MTTFKNYTPDTVTIYDENGRDKLVDFPSVGVVRVKEEVVKKRLVDNVYCVAKQYTECEGLPPYGRFSDVIYIVSVVAFLALSKSGRFDIACPDTGPDSVVRDREGRIIGVKRLQLRGW